ncbi:hypothetical protein [Burkholderia territorii]|uniref:hypothetical protein n=1 Tax=Burkholderia territorii TaxID=1503055 RepID=UPI0012D8C08E|nr:hypothetical protein [Burkholderia territorii]
MRRELYEDAFIPKQMRLPQASSLDDPVLIKQPWVIDGEDRRRGVRSVRRWLGAGSGRADARAWMAASTGDEFGRNPIA